MSEKANDCGCSIHSRIRPSDGASIPYRQTENCRFHALLAEHSELKHCKECDTSGGYHETFCSKVLWACNHAHNLLNARDVLVPELTAKVEKLEQERDALAGEVRRAEIAVTTLIELHNMKGKLIYSTSMEDLIERALIAISGDCGALQEKRS